MASSQSVMVGFPPRDIEVNKSRLSGFSDLSHTSQNSAVTLGGVEYPIGTRVGKSGLFVIGDPEQYSEKSSSMPSVAHSQAAIIPPSYPDGKGYRFESWNWTVIRFCCLVVAVAIMIILLIATIALSIQRKQQCSLEYQWWKGGVMYDIHVPFFRDQDNNKFGDFDGIMRKEEYLANLGVEAVILTDFLPSETSSFGNIKSFTGIDDRFGPLADFDRLVAELHRDKLKVVLRWAMAATSTSHEWFENSRNTGEYSEFYVWNDQPNRHPDYAETLDRRRNEYYLHLNKSGLPLLDYTKSKVHQKVLGEMDFWLRRDIDGFLVTDLEDLYVTSASTVALLVEDMQRQVARYSSDLSHKALMVERRYLDQVNETHANLAQKMVKNIDAMASRIVTQQTNGTFGLVQNVSRGMLWERESDVYTLWSLDRLSAVEDRHVAALQLLLLILPGLPCIVSGQEVGKYYLETKERSPQPMLWRAGTLLPYNPGSSLDDTTIQALRNLIQERRTALALRMIRPDIESVGAEGRTVNYKVDRVDRSMIVISRSFKRRASYFYVGNFGDKTSDRESLSHLGLWGQMVADTRGEYEGRFNVAELLIEPGQAVVFKVES